MAYTTRFGKVVKLGPHVTRSLRVIRVPLPSDKGQFNGRCNRTSCLAPGATWYNRGSYGFYCPVCAHMLNDDNRRDAYEWLGEGNELCIEVKSEAEAATLHVLGRR